jgi:hypothetical protein
MRNRVQHLVNGRAAIHGLRPLAAGVLQAKLPRDMARRRDGLVLAFFGPGRKHPVGKRHRQFGLPGLQRPATLVEAIRPTAVPCAGAIEVLEAAGADIVPLTWCFANPAGPVTAEAVERITALLVAALSDALDAGPLDGIYLELHGAMVAEGFEKHGQYIVDHRTIARSFFSGTTSATQPTTSQS